MKILKYLRKKLCLGFGRMLVGGAPHAMGTITHVETQKPVAALTFDDGPDPYYTPKLLDILQKHGAYATFFLVGNQARNCQDLVEKIVEAGHAIGNHSWDHPSFPLLSKKERQSQILKCEEEIGTPKTRLFRPPFGHQSIGSKLDAYLCGYHVITWNVIVPDWLDHEADWISERLLDEIHPGSIILLHDALCKYSDKRYLDRTPTLHAVEKILTNLKHQLSFVTVPELLKHGKPHRQFWYKKPDAKLLNSLV